MSYVYYCQCCFLSWLTLLALEPETCSADPLTYCPRFPNSMPPPHTMDSRMNPTRLCTKVIKSVSKRFSSYQRVARRQVMRHFTRNGIKQCQNGSLNPLTLFLEQPRSTWIIASYPRPAFSATNRIDRAIIGVNVRICGARGLVN